MSALVLEAPFASTLEIAAKAYPIFPVGWLMKDQFRSDLHIGKVTAQLQAHGLPRGTRLATIPGRVPALHQMPLYNIYSHLVYATKAADVRSVIIHGRIVMQDRRLLTLNEGAIKRDANTYRQKIINSLKN